VAFPHSSQASPESAADKDIYVIYQRAENAWALCLDPTGLDVKAKIYTQAALPVGGGGSGDRWLVANGGGDFAPDDEITSVPVRARLPSGTKRGSDMALATTDSTLVSPLLASVYTPPLFTFARQASPRIVSHGFLHLSAPLPPSPQAPPKWHGRIPCPFIASLINSTPLTTTPRVSFARLALA
jgi:hypothetical protein